MKSKFNPWPYGIVFVFALLISGLATALTIAATHCDALVSENYYEQELRFQNQIDGAARAGAAGAAIEFDAAAGHVAIRLPSTQVAQKLAGTIEFYRPSAPELDRTFPLELQRNGMQSLDVSRFTPGLWRVRVRWQAGGQDYFLEQKISVAAK